MLFLNNRSSGLRKKFWQAFVLQIFLISITVILGIYATRYVLGDILLERALRDEASFFWERYETDRDFRVELHCTVSNPILGVESAGRRAGLALANWR